MSRIGELMALFMQESEETTRSATTILHFLEDRTMDGSNRLRRRKSLQERLRLKNMVCCGSTWPSTMSTRADDVDDDVIDSVHQLIDVVDITPHSDPDCISPSPRMNLAAAERHFRSTAVTAEDALLLSPNNDRFTTTSNDMLPSGSATDPGTPLRISLMRLLEETTDGQDDENEGLGLDRDQMCCVCMGRKKGAAFIPCGHTFCRVCSRELWLNRGTCPLCNRSIIEILDIY